MLGVVVGVPSALVFVLLVGTVVDIRKGKRASEDVKWVIPELLALPTFVLGGPWFTSELVQLFPWDEIKLAYATTVAVIFGSIGFLFLVMLAIQTAGDMWQREPSHV